MKMAEAFVENTGVTSKEPFSCTVVSRRIMKCALRMTPFEFLSSYPEEWKEPGKHFQALQNAVRLTKRWLCADMGQDKLQPIW